MVACTCELYLYVTGKKYDSHFLVITILPSVVLNLLLFFPSNMTSNDFINFNDRSTRTRSLEWIYRHPGLPSFHPPWDFFLWYHGCVILTVLFSCYLGCMPLMKEALAWDTVVLMILVALGGELLLLGHILNHFILLCMKPPPTGKLFGLVLSTPTRNVHILHCVK